MFTSPVHGITEDSYYENPTNEKKTTRNAIFYWLLKRLHISNRTSCWLEQFPNLQKLCHASIKQLSKGIPRENHEKNMEGRQQGKQAGTNGVCEEDLYIRRVNDNLEIKCLLKTH